MVNIYSVHDLVSRTSNASQVSRHLLKHLWKHKTTSSSFGSSGN